MMFKQAINAAHAAATVIRAKSVITDSQTRPEYTHTLLVMSHTHTHTVSEAYKRRGVLLTQQRSALLPVTHSSNEPIVLSQGK